MKLVQRLVISIPSTFIILGLLFFLPAGTIRYWQAWIYLGLMFIIMILIMNYLFRHDRELLARRMQMGEKEKSQKKIIGFGTLFFLAVFLIPGFDFRYGWSSVPFTVVIIADAIFVFGYYLFFLTLKENSYASRIIEVDKKQKVISTGLYAIVRHPMYLSMLLILGITPLCLGSYWGLFDLIPVILVLILRILNEEKVLFKNLPGYKNYLLKVKYRLIPGLW